MAKTKTLFNTERDMIRWVRMGLDLKYDWDKMEKVLLKAETSLKTINEIKKIYLEETEDTEKIKLSLVQRMKLKRAIKGANRKLQKAIGSIEYMKNLTRKKTKKELENLEKMKTEMITAIIGDSEKGLQGLVELFDAYDEEGARIELTQQQLTQMSVDEVMEIFEDLVYELKRNI